MSWSSNEQYSPLLTKPLSNMPTKTLGSLLAIIPVALAIRFFIRASRSRTRKITPTQERVLILGASSGIGRSVAHKYAKRGARVCIVARREAKVEEVVQECRVEKGSEDGIVGCAADFTNVEDMIRVRNLVAEGTCAIFLLKHISYKLTQSGRG